MFSLLDLLRNDPAAAGLLAPVGVLDLGAMHLEGHGNAYDPLAARGFARIVGFEPVGAECDELNRRHAGSGKRYLPYFIGDGSRQFFHLTNQSMTASLYEPNTPLLSLFQQLAELTTPVSVEPVTTKRLDDIAEIDFPVDYMKLDIQGAELQALAGARERVLKDTLVIHTEVEWVPMYKGQPLFSEVELFLRGEGFLFHKILGYGTRSFKPFAMGGNPLTGPQQLWSDVVFVRDFTRLDRLAPAQLLKTALILHECYGSLDFAHLLIEAFDRRTGTTLATTYRDATHATPAAPSVPGRGASPAPPAAQPAPAGRHPFVHHFEAGVSAFERNDLPAALQAFHRAAAIRDDFAQLHQNLGIILGRLGRLAEARRHLERALALQPDYPEARALLAALQPGTTALAAPGAQASRPAVASADPEALARALALQSAGKLDEAEPLFREMLARHPDDLAALYSLGSIRFHRGDLDGALRLFEQAHARKDDFAPLHYNLGVTLQALKRFDRAVFHYDRALALDPNYREPLLNKACALAEAKRHKEALLTLEELLRLDPDNAKALGNRGILLTDFKLFDDASRTFERLLAVDPGYDYAPGLLAFSKMHACEWDGLEPLARDIVAAVRAGRRACKTLAFTALTDDPHDHLACARIFADHFFPRREPLHRGERYGHRKIRVAYLSPDLREHPVGHLTAGLFEKHDRERFELTAVSIGIDDGSAIRARMMKAFDEFLDARAIPSDEIAHMLREREIDILVDLAGYTADSRSDILARRPVPIQVNYLGYSSTLGAAFADYLVADRHIIPAEFRDAYEEKIVWLPDTYLPVDDSIRIAAPPPRAAYGLPEHGLVFCSFNHDYKINPPMFAVWMRLLKEIPGSVLWLMKLNEPAERNLRKAAAARGIDPARIIFATRVPRIEDHLARYRLADLFLDTFPCNAHSTTSDVLRAGLPVVTLRGRSFASRVASGLLQLAGLPELVTERIEDYEALALALARDPARLAALRGRLERRMAEASPFSTERHCRQLEEAFRMMVARHESGLAPDHLVVPGVSDAGISPSPGKPKAARGAARSAAGKAKGRKPSR